MEWCEGCLCGFGVMLFVCVWCGVGRVVPL